MRIFLAGASGVIGVRLVPLLVAEGHVVGGMTRTAGKAADLEALGAEPILCDVFDRERLTIAVASFAPDAVMHQMTDLPDEVDDLPRFAPRNDRMRSEGTANLLHAARAYDSRRLLAQSIAWTPTRGAETVLEHERQVLDADGTVIRYGQFYGPGTYYESELPPPPRIHVDEAARATVALLDAPAGIVIVAEGRDDAPIT